MNSDERVIASPPTSSLLPTKKSPTARRFSRSRMFNGHSFEFSSKGTTSPFIDFAGLKVDDLRFPDNCTDSFRFRKSMRGTAKNLFTPLKQQNNDARENNTLFVNIFCHGDKVEKFASERKMWLSGTVFCSALDDDDLTIECGWGQFLPYWDSHYTNRRFEMKAFLSSKDRQKSYFLHSEELVSSSLNPLTFIGSSFSTLCRFYLVDSSERTVKDAPPILEAHLESRSWTFIKEQVLLIRGNLFGIILFWFFFFASFFVLYLKALHRVLVQAPHIPSSGSYFNFKEGAFYNWNRTQKNFILPENYREPISTEEIVQIVKESLRSKTPIHATGSFHSFSDCAFSTGILLNMRTNFSHIFSLRLPDGILTVQSGATFDEILKFAECFGLTLPNFPPLLQQTIGGAIASGAHGTLGKYRESFTESIIEIEYVDGIGQVKKLNDPSKYANFGLIGVITTVKVRLVPMMILKKENFSASWKDATRNAPVFLQNNDFVRIRGSIHSKNCLLEISNRSKSFGRRKRLWSIITTLIFFYFWRFFGSYVGINCGNWRRFRFFSSVRVILAWFFDPISNQSSTSLANPLILPQMQSEWAISIEQLEETVTNLRNQLKKIKIPMELHITFSHTPTNWITGDHGHNIAYIQLSLPISIPNDDATDILKRFQQTMENAKGYPQLSKLIAKQTPYLSKAIAANSHLLDFIKESDPSHLFANEFSKRFFEH